MFKSMSKEEFLKAAADGHRRISLYREFPSDRLTPIQAFEALGELADKGTILESALFDEKKGRFSHIFLQPEKEYSISFNNEKSDCSIDEKFSELRELLKEHKCFISHDSVHMLGGMVGFMTYDAVRFFEKIPGRHKNISTLPEIFFRFYNSVITFDHQIGKITISSAVVNEGAPEAAFEEGLKSLDMIIQKLESFHIKESTLYKTGLTNNKNNGEFECSIEDEDFIKLVKKAKEYIYRGDTFQVVLSRKFTRKISASPFKIYRALRISNPSAYMFFMECNGTYIAGSSPERLASVKNGILETHPIAGTRKRGETSHLDMEIAEELLKDKKEVAEHVMLVDLARNDVGSVAIPGSVTIKKFKDIQYLSKVMHITSVVEGKLSEEKDSLDALRAVFPAGTLSGAPKIRAMEIIDELENCRRSLYGGAVCFIDNDGNLESCIAIRMALMKDSLVTIQAGCGIVFDSDPQFEAEETRAKASAILNAVDLAEGGF